MSWRINTIIGLLFFVACTQEKQSIAIPEKATPVQSKYLIEAEELASLIGRSNFKIIDFRKPKEYKTDHITNAINIWRSDIEDSTFSYSGMMAGPNQIESLFSERGISNQDTLIIYDDNGLCDSSRLWWILENYDFNQVKLLHGGYSAWKAIGGEVTNKVNTLPRSSFDLTRNPSMKYFISKEGVSAKLATSTILDTRTTDEYSGKRQKKGAAQGGRIPNSQHIDWAEAIDYNGDKKFKSIEELLDIYGELNPTEDNPILVYCHSGVRSAHTTFVLTQLLGLKHVKNYDGSWTEWSQFEDLEIEKDSITTIKT